MDDAFPPCKCLVVVVLEEEEEGVEEASSLAATSVSRGRSVCDGVDKAGEDEEEDEDEDLKEDTSRKLKSPEAVKKSRPSLTASTARRVRNEIQYIGIQVTFPSTVVSPAIEQLRTGPESDII